MAQVDLSPRALLDLERLYGFIAPRDCRAALAQLEGLHAALLLLADHPLLGHEAEDGRRELVLARGRAGYVVKYRWLPRHDRVVVLTIRHQREAGYPEE